MTVVRGWDLEHRDYYLMYTHYQLPDHSRGNPPMYLHQQNNRIISKAKMTKLCSRDRDYQ